MIRSDVRWLGLLCIVLMLWVLAIVLVHSVGSDIFAAAKLITGTLIIGAGYA